MTTEKNFGWEDEEEVDECEELLRFFYCGQSFSIQEVCVKGQARVRLSTGTLFGSQSVHLDTLRNTVIAANRVCDSLAENEERERLGKKRKPFDPKCLDGFLRHEKRVEKEKVT